MSNKTFGWIVVFIVLVIAVLSFYIYSFSNDKKISISISDITNKISDKDKDDDDDEDSRSTEDANVTEYKEVTKYDDFFDVNRVINDFYISLTTLDNARTYGLLDNAYIKSHDITEKNCGSILETYFNDITFYAEEMYVKSKAGVYYYFVKGSTETYDMSTEYLDLGEDAYFLVIVDHVNSTYAVYPLTYQENIKEYGESYNVPKSKVIKDNDYNNFISEKRTDVTIAKYYLAHYSKLIYLNTEKAYGLLGETTKAKYPKLEDFTKDLDNIYKKLETNLTGINVSDEKVNRTYILSDGKSITITMKERSINNFEIDF